MALINNTDYSGIRSAILAWSDAVVGSGKTKWAKTDFPKIVRPFATLEMTELGQDQGIDERFEVNNGGILEVSYIGLREMQIHARILGVAPTTISEVWPKDLLQNMLLTLSSESVIAAFRVLPLAFIRHTPIISADEQVGKRWEWIAETFLTFSYRSVLFDDGLSDPPDDGVFIESADVTVNDEPTFSIDSTP